MPVIPREFSRTTEGVPFLVYDSGPGDDRLIIFASESALDFLANSSEWYCDGTFKVVPEIFYQLYTVHGEHDGRIFPCVFALLPNKSQHTYERFFTELMREISARNPAPPQHVLLDFEKGAINAIRNTIPDTDVKGCFFHFSQNIWRAIQRVGLDLTEFF